MRVIGALTGALRDTRPGHKVLTPAPMVEPQTKHTKHVKETCLVPAVRSRLFDQTAPSVVVDGVQSDLTVTEAFFIVTVSLHSFIVSYAFSVMFVCFCYHMSKRCSYLQLVSSLIQFSSFLTQTVRNNTVGQKSI